MDQILHHGVGTSRKTSPGGRLSEAVTFRDHSLAGHLSIRSKDKLMPLLVGKIKYTTYVYSKVSDHLSEILAGTFSSWKTSEHKYRHTHLYTYFG